VPVDNGGLETKIPSPDPYITPHTTCVELAARNTDLVHYSPDTLMLMLHKAWRYRAEKADHWQCPDEFVFNDLVGDCEDRAFYVQSVLIAKHIPCISVWGGNHVWNQAYHLGRYWERVFEADFRPRDRKASLMTWPSRFPWIVKETWRWVRYDPEWYS